MYHYIYKTVNLKNNKYYIGIHSTNNLDDGYLGSGTYLKNAIKKYGKKNFECNIISFYDNRKELKKAEYVIVNQDILRDKNCMNLKRGGTGGWDYINKHKLGKPNFGTPKVVKKCLEKLKFKRINDKEFSERYNKKVSESLKEKYKNEKHPWEGRKHTEETIKKMRKSAKGKYIGKRNSQYGTCWMYNNIKCIKVKANEIVDYARQGYIVGRKMEL